MTEDEWISVSKAFGYVLQRVLLDARTSLLEIPKMMDGGKAL